MPGSADIAWFKQHFADEVAASLGGTPFDIDMLVAIACQETGHIWSTLRTKTMTTQEILALCVGDTLDATKGRTAFPRTKADLLAAPHGQRMFDIARAALEAMSQHIPGFAGAVSNPNKFCHGFGMFQYDLQFFQVDPDYFLEKRYEAFPSTLGKCLEELGRAQKRAKLGDKTSLTDLEFAAVAIAYNTGTFKPSKGLKQGHFNGTRFYGEEIFDFLRLSRTVAKPGGGAPAITEPPPGHAILPPPAPVASTGATFVVDTKTSPLRLRREPRISKPPEANVRANLPDGQLVRAVSDQKTGVFLEVETSLAGALLRGFVSTEFLVPVAEPTPIPIETPSPTAPTSGVVAVTMPRKPGTVTKRTALADAHSLNEPDRPGRTGATAAELVTELLAIVDWLAVDKPSHKRYLPRDGLTFCNVYAHDFCALAGVYLPRVWWTAKSIQRITLGETVQPLIESTITEVRANDLFRWLRDFGGRFGWRQAGSLDELQQSANQGAVGLIAARRKQDGKSGHIVVVLPESDRALARRNTAGSVVAPVQSQAGAKNFRAGTGKVDWWLGSEFAEGAFWLHA